MKFIFKIFKRIIYSSFLLYGYNYISINFNMIIPYNVFSLGLVFLLGPLGLFVLSIFKLFL